MDNTPRGNDKHYLIYWIDAISQQALSALYISRLADEIGEEGISREYKAKYEEKIKELLELAKKKKNVLQKQLTTKYK